MARIYYNKDANLNALKGKKVAVIGYGIQGRAQSLNLRDSGVNVVVGLKFRDDYWKRAKADKMEVLDIPTAVKSADIVMMLIPDEVQKMAYDSEVAPNLKAGMTLDFAHGFNIHFKLIVPPKDVDVIMVAPKGPGALVRETFVAGNGVPALIAVHQDASGKAKKTALAIAKGLGATTKGVIETTFTEETETDLFGEQVDLCGGASDLIKKSFEVLVEAGYQPEIAYFEVLHELKLIIDLVQKGGIEGMWNNVSNTAEYGGRTRGPRIIDARVKKSMQAVLKEIQSGAFAKEWVNECNSGMVTLTKLRKDGEKDQIEVVGRSIRKMFK
ncbi:MAG: ketol-acid reductoisomerase [Thermoplasmata archaeon]|nr:ketol-acid reductoisomerase [Thermoplasmata archaeon]TFG70874.1 MAG: ketol-acid reductoisomerase [Methanomassiliicoccus sp.]